MIQIKKTILTLVALLAVTTGAWAQEQWDVVWDFTAWSTETVTALKADAAASKTEGWSDVEKAADAEAGVDPDAAAKDNCFWFAGTVNEDGSLSANGAVIKELKGLKFNSDYAAKRSLAIAVNYPSTPLGDYAGGAYLWLGDGGSKQTFPCFTIPGVKAGSKITIEVESNKPSDGRGIGLYKNSYAAENLIGEQFKPTAKEAKTWEIAEDCDVVVWNTKDCHIYTIKVKAPAASAGPEVAWNKAEKTGTFTMPGGNVTLEPEYYPQATLAFHGLTAAEDAAAKTEAPLAVVADGAVTGGTLMYYVAPDKNFSQADAIALAEDAWSAAIPTAETVEAAGTCYVWYYIKGDDEHSDTDPVPLVVTVLPEPTYTVEFAEGTPESDKWKAEPAAGVTKGETVTVTYTGSKKVIGVKAEKKASTPSLSLTNPTVGQVIGSDGKNYAAASVPSGVDKVAMIAYVSGSNGLAIALADEGEINWATAKSTCEAKTPAFTNGTWKLPSQDEWKQMFSANGGSEDSYNGLNTAITTAGGTAFQDGTVNYWSSSEDSDQAYLAQFYYGYPLWFKDWKVNERWVRACLAF